MKNNRASNIFCDVHTQPAIAEIGETKLFVSSPNNDFFLHVRKETSSAIEKDGMKPVQ